LHWSEIDSLGRKIVSAPRPREMTAFIAMHDERDQLSI
jgi:hypothetical protein